MSARCRHPFKKGFSRLPPTDGNGGGYFLTGVIFRVEKSTLSYRAAIWYTSRGHLGPPPPEIFFHNSTSFLLFKTKWLENGISPARRLKVFASPVGPLNVEVQKSNAHQRREGGLLVMLVPRFFQIGAPSAKPRGIKWKPGNLACGKRAQWRGPQNH